MSSDIEYKQTSRASDAATQTTYGLSGTPEELSARYDENSSEFVHLMSRSTLDQIPFVSVIIPAFRDSRHLEICLRALQKQTYPKDRYEVIVANNGPNGDIDSLVATFKGFDVRVVEEDRIGSYAARNKGLSVAKGEVVAFTDSDCIPAFDWIEKGVQNLLNAPSRGVIKGRVKLFYRNAEKPTAVELYDYIVSRRQEVEMQYGRTANLIAFRSVFEEVGLFDEKLKSGGDVEWGQRAYSRGHAPLYAHDVCVAHPARHSIDQISRKAMRVEGGAHDYSHPHSLVSPVKRFLSRFMKEVVVVCLNDELNLIQKAKVIFVLLSVQYVKSLERLRLTLGGESRRS